MHFVDSWTELTLVDLLRLLAPAVFLGLAILIPGRRAARPASAALAFAVLFLPELGPRPLVLAWCVLWLAVAWVAGVLRRNMAEAPEGRPGAAESGTIGLLLGLALLALLVAGVARQDLSPEEGRRASWGLIIMGGGLLHLMLRRHARRAVVGIAALGLGLQMLDTAGRGAQVPGTLPAFQGGVVVATAVAVALMARVAGGRERVAGSARIGDAHDLHD